MNSQTKKYIVSLLAGLAAPFFLSSCGTETTEGLDEASDFAEDTKNDLLDGRGETPAKPPVAPDKDDAVTPVTPAAPEPFVPEFGDDEEGDNFDPDDDEPSCGDGSRNVETEECDDDNRVNGDGCDASCQSEAVVVASARTSLDVGYAHVCLIDEHTRQLKCWGLNDYGQLGIGSTAEVGDGVGVAVSGSTPIDVGTGMSTELVVAGGASGTASTCVITNKNEVKCFGDNASGQLGKDATADLGDGANEMGSNLSAVNLGTGRTATDIDSGTSHQCALLDNGSVKCWGLNDAGQLGQGNTTTLGDGAGEMAALAAVPIGANAVAVAVGSKHSCVITATNTVKCWGLNASGQLGQDSVASLGDGAGEVAALAAVNLGAGRTALAIAAGADHTCALLDNHTVKCWGLNASGQLGQDSTDSLGDGAGEMAALAAVNLGAGRTATAIAAGANYSCALLDNSTVKCWGENTSGQLGKDSTAALGDGAGEMAALTAINLGAGRTGAVIAAGGSTTCALLDDDTLKCWGENASGQLGKGSTADLGDGAGEMTALTAITTGF